MNSIIPTLLLFKGPLLDCVKLACASPPVVRYGSRFSNQELFSLDDQRSTVKILKDSHTVLNKQFKRPKVTMEFSRQDKNFCLEDYDAIGFDLDNTLATYNVKNLYTMEYDCLREFLVKHKNYKPDTFKHYMSEDDFHFLQRGLIVDAKRGNLLKVDYMGKILKAAHGTKILSEDETKSVYGNDLTWEVTNQFVTDFLSTWNGPLSEQMRAFLDYFDIPGVLLFAQAVDYLDKENGYKPLESYNVYADIQEGFIHMYTPSQFEQNKGYFFPALKENPEKYYMKSPPHVLNWLKELRSQGKILFILTGSFVDYARLTATTCLGKDWESYFDYIGYFAKKPGFFTGANRPFLSVTDDLKEGPEIPVSELNKRKKFSQGNWEGLMEAMKVKLNKSSIQPVYLGDNFIQDLYTPAKYSNIDTVAVCLEEIAENPIGKNLEHVDFLKTDSWGPYFQDGNKVPTIWGNILKAHCKICVPSVSYLASESTDKVYQTFDKRAIGLNEDGIYPR